MKTQNEIESALAQFYGTNEWHRWSVLFPYTLTDGAKFVADECQAYWLMDAIASWQASKLRGQPFQVWNLVVGDRSAVLICDNGNGKELCRQKIPYTDFPLPEITLYFIDGVILLPSEY